jgi:hypothetical protein
MNNNYKLAKMVYIDSEFRNVGETPTNFTYLVNDPLHDIKAIIVRDAQMTNTLYSFKASNNKFYYRWDTGVANTEHSITISIIKSYSASDLVTDINALFTANGHAITATFSSTSGKLTLTSATLFRPETTTEQVLSTANTKLGFTASSYVGATSFIANDILRVYPFFNVFIVSNLGKQISEHMNENLNRILCKMVVDENFGGVLRYYGDSAMDLIEYQNPLYIDRIDIRLYDDDAELINMNGGEFTMSIHCFT